MIRSMGAGVSRFMEGRAAGVGLQGVSPEEQRTSGKALGPPFVTVVKKVWSAVEV